MFQTDSRADILPWAQRVGTWTALFRETEDILQMSFLNTQCPSLGYYNLDFLKVRSSQMLPHLLQKKPEPQMLRLQDVQFPTC